MRDGKEYVVPFLLVVVVLVGATIVAGWAGFFIALAALIFGGLIGASYMATQVQQAIDKTLADAEEQPFPFL